MSCEGWEVGDKCLAGETIISRIRIFNIPLWSLEVPGGIKGIVVKKWASKHKLAVSWAYTGNFFHDIILGMSGMPPYNIYGIGSFLINTVLSHSQIHKLRKIIDDPAYNLSTT